MSDTGLLDLEDAFVEDTVHCDMCGAGWDIGGNAEGIAINSPRNGDPLARNGMVQLKLCIDCALFIAMTLSEALSEKDICEHGVCCGDWCEPCNREYKRARLKNGLES